MKGTSVPATPVSCARPRVVVVDDEISICQMMEDYFQRLGYDITCISDADEAMRRLPEMEIDLLISDLKLSPSVDGIAILRRLHETHPDSVGILMTAHPSLDIAVQVLKEGAYDYLQKPVNLAELRTTVERALEKRDLSRQLSQLTSAINMIRQGQADPTFYLPSLLQRLVDAGVRELDTRGGAILLAEGDACACSVRLGAVAGKLEAVWTDDLARAYAGVVAEMKARRNAEGVFLPAAAPSIPGMAGAEVLAYPISADNQLLGLFCVGFEPGRAGERRRGAALSLYLDSVARTIEYGRIHEQLRFDYISVIRALSNAVEAKDPYTRGHSDRVVHYSESVGRMLGFDRVRLEKLGVAGILHDIGKIGVPDAVLVKPDRLTEREWSHMKRHPGIGDKILEPIGSLSDVRTWIFQHHERMDGKGYPRGVLGDQISPEARLLIVCEVFDALVTERAYKPAWPIEKTIQYLWDETDHHFDRTTVEAFIAALEEQGEAFLHFDPATLITHAAGL